MKTTLSSSRRWQLKELISKERRLFVAKVGEVITPKTLLRNETPAESILKTARRMKRIVRPERR